MKVDKINYNLTGSQLKTARTNQPRFTGGISTSAVVKEIDPLMPKVIRWINKLNQNKGEAQDIFINALGTGLIAPIFIKWNPLSKSDEDTRTYSAMRQPISAVLAVITQAGVTIPYNIWQGRKFDEGLLKSINRNRSLFQDEKYLTRMMKQLHPEETKEGIEKLVNKFKDTQADELSKAIKNNKIEVRVKENGKEKLKAVPDSEFNKLVNDTFDTMISEEEAEKTRCLKEKKNLKIERSEFYRTNGDEAKKLINEINDEITKNSDPKTIEAKINDILKNLKKDKKNPELINVIQEIHDRGILKDKDCVKAVKQKIESALKDIDEVKGLSSKADVEKLISNNIEFRVKGIDEHLENLKELKKAFADGKITVGELETRIQNLITKNTTLLENTAKKKGNTKVLESLVERLNNVNLTNKIAELYKDKIKGNIDSFKRMTNLVVAFAMLPITCSLLNWVYPRLMDILFPNLSNKKHAKVSTEFVDKASKKAEVK